MVSGPEQIAEGEQDDKTAGIDRIRYDKAWTQG
jgi:hypothetical protein